MVVQTDNFPALPLCNIRYYGSTSLRGGYSNEFIGWFCSRLFCHARGVPFLIPCFACSPVSSPSSSFFLPSPAPFFFFFRPYSAPLQHVRGSTYSFLCSFNYYLHDVTGLIVSVTHFEVRVAFNTNGFTSIFLILSLIKWVWRMFTFTLYLSWCTFGVWSSDEWFVVGVWVLVPPTSLSLPSSLVIFPFYYVPFLV